MLAQRLLTALLLVPVVVAGLLWLQTPMLALLLGAVFLLAAAELARLANLADRRQQLVYVVSLGVLLLTAWFWRQQPAVPMLMGLVVVWWIGTTALLLSRRRALDPVQHPRPAVLAWGAVVLMTAWLALLVLHGSGEQGPALVLFLFVLIWVADSAAFFAGRQFGQRKLSPFVSPGKTWAGAVGALLGAVLCALALFATGFADVPHWPGLLALCLLVTIVSIGGDLWESRLKRESGVKDSGQLLPGHGGVLDRIDSLIAAAPVFVVGVQLLDAAP